MKTVLLDGLWGAAWRLERMRKTLKKRGIEGVEIFSYDSGGRVPIERLADQFADWLGGGECRIVAHSMGGLVTRVAKERHPGLDIAKAVFLCVPHHGTKVAHLLPFAGIRQMREGSGLITKLAEQRWEIPTLVVWCPFDALVVPGASAKWEKAEREICCRFPLHNWPVLSSWYHHQIADFFLGEPEGEGEGIAEGRF